MTTIRIISSGQRTTIQDLGRHGHSAYGVASAGAADHLSHRLGNRLLGNPDEAASLEMTSTGAVLSALGAVRVALAGSAIPAHINGRPVEAAMWRRLELAPGDELALGATVGGARTYLCIEGGIDVPPVLGSRSTHMATGVGPLEGRACAEGDTLSAGQRRSAAPPARIDHQVLRQLTRELTRRTIRIVAGPSATTALAAIAHLVDQTWRIGRQSDRIGLRLEGTPCPEARIESQTEGVCPGMIQLLPNGQPIVLGVDCAPTGGYPIIASVIAADMAPLGQRRADDAIRFLKVTIDEARQINRDRMRTLDAAIPPAPGPTE